MTGGELLRDEGQRATVEDAGVRCMWRDGCGTTWAQGSRAHTYA